jgi:hypothetical protein
MEDEVRHILRTAVQERPEGVQKLGTRIAQRFLRIPAKLNARSGDDERRFRASRTLIGAKRRRQGSSDPPYVTAASGYGLCCFRSSTPKASVPCGACGRRVLQRRPTTLWETRAVRFPQVGHDPQAAAPQLDCSGCPRSADRRSGRP